MEFIQALSRSESTSAHAPEDKCHINTLPTELLLSIFSFLAPRDHLEVREVCRRWAQVLTVSTPIFSNSTTFALSPGTDAYSTLLSSGAVWKHVQITGLESTPEARDWFRSLAIGSVRRLVFRNSVITRSFLQTAPVEFPHLEELELINSKVEEDDGMIGAEAPNVTLWQDFLKVKLKSLTLESEETVTLRSHLRTFTCQGACLTKLVIRLVSNAQIHQPMYPLFTMIQNSCSSLREFSLTARHVATLERFWYFFPFDCPRMNLLRLRAFEVISTNPDSTPYVGTGNYLIDRNYLRFLRSQTDLTSLSLSASMALSELAERVTFLPNNLEAIGIGCVSAFGLHQFIMKLGKVKEMTLHSWRDEFLHFNTRLLGCVLPELERLTVYDRPGRLGFTLTNSFPNLRKLVITCSSEEASVDTVNDAELQLIIAKLTRLTVLKLSSCARITDLGVAGIEGQLSDSLVRSRTPGLGWTYSVTSRNMTGLPLNELKDLEELSLEGSSQISDVGAIYGLGFRNLRQLDLATGNKELTDWGLFHLAILNPKLERMHVETSHCTNRASLEEVLVTQLKSSSRRRKRINVSLKARAEPRAH